MVNAVAQDPALFDTTWYIHKITIDNVDTFPPPDTEPIPYEETQFFISPGLMGTGYCDLFTADIVYSAVENTFDSPGFTELGGSCNNIDNLNFTSLYYYFLSVDNSMNIETFEYEITVSGSSKALLLTNRLGDSVLYGDEVLGIGDNELPVVLIYPNPTTEFLHLVIGLEASITLTMYDIGGSVVRTLSEVKSNTPIDVSTLDAGIYFAKIINEHGQEQVVRFIKK